MEMAEGEGSTEEKCVDIETTAASLRRSAVFHIIIDAVGFVLYMHQQIPSVLQDMSLDFDTLQMEYKELEANIAQPEVRPLVRRQLMSRKREIKYEIRKLEKLMNAVSSLRKALQQLICEIPDIQRVTLVLGGSPLRPQQVYEFFFSHRDSIPSDEGDFAKSKAAEALSKKAIRALISKDAGCSSYPGPMKLFVLVLAPASLNLPQHFLPKRDFRYNRKIVPLRLRFKCRTQGRTTTACAVNSDTNDLMWFQCRHVIKGLAFQPPVEE